MVGERGWEWMVVELQERMDGWGMGGGNGWLWNGRKGWMVGVNRRREWMVVEW